MNTITLNQESDPLRHTLVSVQTGGKSSLAMAKVEIPETLKISWFAELE
jgi:hypothetical protein